MNFRRYLIELNDKQKLIDGGVNSFCLFLNYINCIPRNTKTVSEVREYIRGCNPYDDTISKEDAEKLFTKAFRDYKKLYDNKRKEMTVFLKSYSTLKAKIKEAEGTERARIKRELLKMKSLIEKLDPEEQKIIGLHYFNNLTVAEVGANLGLTKNQTSAKITQIKEKLTDLYMNKKGDD